MSERRLWKLPHRAVLVLAGSGLLVAGVGPVAASAEKQTENVRFDYVKDRKAWFWRHQQRHQVTGPSVPPAPTVVHEQAVPHPHIKEDTLPVAVYRGEHEMMSAIAFGLSTRGVTPGSEISRFELSIEEGASRGEQPSIHPEDAKIQACTITDFWPSTDEGQEWDLRPPFNENDCIQGKRKAPEGKTPSWRFELKRIATAWGEEPFESHGVMLLAKLPKEGEGGDTWHVNLKIPAQDDAETKEDEYKQTRNRVRVVMTFIPGEEEPPPIVPPASSGTGGGSFFSSPSTSFGSSTTFTGGAGGSFSDFSGAGASDVPMDEETAEAPNPAITPAAAEGPAPKLPGYVWALLPLGLLALGAVRSVVTEPLPGTRPDGVIAAIRRRNAERRGGPLRQISDPASVALTAFRRGLSRTGQTFTTMGSKARRIVRSVRR